MCVVSMRTPGPIVDDSVTLLRNLPLAAAGFALTMLSTSACALATSESVANEVLPTGAWMMPVLSTRNSTLPAWISFAADDVGARFLGFLLFLAARDRKHPLALAEAVRQDHGAADHLVRVLRIHAQPQGQLHGLVELGELDLLHERDRVFDRVGPIGRDLRARSRELLAALSHRLSCGPNERLRCSPTLLHVSRFKVQ